MLKFENSENYTVMAKMAFPSTLLFISLLSLAHSKASSGQPISGVTLAGIVTCINASIATARTYPVIPGARVDVVCGILFLAKVIKSSTTNLAGIYSFSFNVTDMLLLNVPEMCYLNVTLPDNLCMLNPSGGFLKFPIIGMRSGLGLVNEFIPGSPRYLRL